MADSGLKLIANLLEGESSIAIPDEGRDQVMSESISTDPERTSQLKMGIIPKKIPDQSPQPEVIALIK